VAAPARGLALRSGLGLASIYVSMGLLARGSAFLVMPIAAARLSISEFGFIAVCAATQNLSAMVQGLGFQIRLQRSLVGNLHNSGAYPPSSIYWAGTAWGMGCGVLGVAVAGLAHWVDASPSVSLLVLSVADGAFSILTSELGLPYLRMRQRVWSFVSTTGTSTALQMGLRVWVLIFTDWGVAGWVLSGLAARILSGLLAIALGSLSPELSLRTTPTQRLAAFKDCWQTARNVVPFNFSHWGLNLGDRLLVTWLVGLAANGLYSLAYQFAVVLGLIFGEIVNALLPKLAASRSQHAAQEFRWIPLSFAILTLMWSFISAGAILQFLPVVYGEATALIPVLCIAQLALGFTQVSIGIGTVLTKHVPTLWISSWVGLVVNLLIDFLFLSHGGVVVAAIGSALGYVASWAVLYRSITNADLLEQWRSAYVSLSRSMLRIFLLASTILIFVGIL
jgi:O-antigen/teichoic acid export membrane protein